MYLRCKIKIDKEIESMKLFQCSAVEICEEKSATQVHKSDGLWNKVVDQSSCFRLHTPVVSAWWQKCEKAVMGVCAVPDDAMYPSDDPGVINVPEWGGAHSNDIITLCRALLSSAVQLPCHTVMKPVRTLYCTPVEVMETYWKHAGFF